MVCQIGKDLALLFGDGEGAVVMPGGRRPGEKGGNNDARNQDVERTVGLIGLGSVGQCGVMVSAERRI